MKQIDWPVMIQEMLEWLCKACYQQIQKIDGVMKIALSLHINRQTQC